MVLVSASTIAPVFFGHFDIPSGMITFICFLPLVILFSEQSTKARIFRLEARIAELEERNKSCEATSDNVSR